jgi:hypothetical protein
MVTRSRKIASTLFFLGAAGTVLCLSLFFTNYSFLFRKPASLLFPFLLITATLFFASVYIAANKKRYIMPDIAANLRRIDEWKALGAAIFILSGIVFLLSTTRYNSYSSNFDLAIYEQIIWNSAHGRFFVSIMGDCNSSGIISSRSCFSGSILQDVSDVGFFRGAALALSSAMIPFYLIAKRS